MKKFISSLVLASFLVSSGVSLVWATADKVIEVAGSNSIILKTNATSRFTVGGNGNLGVGQTPSSTTGTLLRMTTPNSGLIRLSTTDSTNNEAYVNFQNTTGDSYFGREDSDGGNILSGSSPYSTLMVGNSAHPIQFGTNNVLRGTIGTSGDFTFQTNQNATTYLNVKNTTSGTAATSEVIVGPNSGGVYGIFGHTSAGFTGSGVRQPNSSFLAGFDTAGLLVGTTVSAPLKFYTNNTEKVQIDSSGRVGIGTTPAGGRALDILAPNAFTKVTSSTGTNEAYSLWENTGGTSVVGNESSAGGVLLSGSSSYATVLGTSGARSLQFGTNNTVRATIDSSGVATFTQGVVVGGNTTGDANYGTISSVQATRNYRGSFTATFTGATTNFSSTQTVTVNYVRQNDLVTLTIPGKTSTCGSGTVAALTSDAIPSNLRPTLQTNTPVFVNNNGSFLDTPGDFSVTTGGVLTFQRTTTATAFTASATCGWRAYTISYVL